MPPVTYTPFMVGQGSAPGGDAGEEIRFQLTERRWRWLVDFSALGPQDLVLLRESLPVEEVSEAVAASFYDHVLAYPELRALIESTTTVERLRDRLKQCFCSLLSGEFDDARVDELERLARTHDRIGLPFTTYLGATLQLDHIVIPEMVRRYAHEPATLTRALMAYRKLFTCDLAIVAETYWNERNATTVALVERAGFCP